MKKQSFRIDHGTYPFDILVCIGYSHHDVCVAVKKTGYVLNDSERDKLHKEGIGRTVMLEGGATVIQVDPIKDKAHFHANVAHEIFHAVEFLFNAAGLKHHISAGEAWAYQVQHLTKQFYEKLNK